MKHECAAYFRFPCGAFFLSSPCRTPCTWLPVPESMAFPSFVLGACQSKPSCTFFPPLLCCWVLSRCTCTANACCIWQADLTATTTSFLELARCLLHSKSVNKSWRKGAKGSSREACLQLHYKTWALVEIIVPFGGDTVTASLQHLLAALQGCLLQNCIDRIQDVLFQAL